MENNRLKLGFKPKVITKLIKGAGINPLIINLSFITLDITDHLIQTKINKKLNKGSNYFLVETVFRYQLK